jgi:hypothetical protein
MKPGSHFHHTVAIAGVVRDAVSQARIGRALIEIKRGPPKFRAMVQALDADPRWRSRTERLDRTWSQADGLFYFLDLPAGQYRLRVSLVDLSSDDPRLRGSLVTTPPDDYRARVNVRQLGTRYRPVEIGPLRTHAHKRHKPVLIARADVALPPTRIHGTVTANGSDEPVAGARVRLRGDTTVVLTGDDGSYELMPLVAGAPTVEVSAVNYKKASQAVTLAPGQDCVVNFLVEYV